MSTEIGVSGGLEPARPDTQATSWSARAPAWVGWPVAHWELVVGGFAVAAAAVGFWVTLHAHFLQYPGWLAVQKADFILGPIGVGLYWHHRRPDNRLGLMLIALGLVFIPYMLESIRSPYAFTIGTMVEGVYTPMALAVVLAFPNGRLDGRAERVILVVNVLCLSLFYVVWLLVSPELIPRGSLAGCRALCPRDPFAIWSTPSWYPQSLDFVRAGVVVVALATVVLLVWKFVTGTPPRRRALAVGAPVALCYLMAQATYQAVQLVDTHFGGTIYQASGPWQWVIAAGRAFLWYGFLFALIAAELYAGRVLRRLNRDSLGRPSFRELEGLLRGPLGDPGLRLGFWRAQSSEWVDADGARLAGPGAGQVETEVDRDGRAVIAIVHDQQLSDDPELLRAAGAVALLALENAELDAGWRDALRELGDSRARVAAAGDRERRKLERDLHDSAQQRFVAAEINLALAGDQATDNAELIERITDARTALEEGLEQLREIAHGIYPRALARWGLPRALSLLAARYPGKATVTEADVGRCPPEIEAAVYYGCVEAVQNAFKHAGPDAHISIRLYTDQDLLFLDVRDDGRGFDVDAVSDGVGLENIRDRFGAVGGRAEIRSQPGRGTVMSAAAPLGNRSTRDPQPAQRDLSLTVARRASTPPAS